MRVAAAVLAGGRSSRMGRTKAMIEVGGRAMADRVIDAARAAGCEPVVVYGGDRDELAPLSAPVVDDRYPGEGPVGGVLGALEHFARHDPVPDLVLIAACDLPDLAPASLSALVDAATQHGGPATVTVARTDRIEPLCALWPIGVRPGVARAFDSGERAVHRLLDSLATVEVTVPAAVLRNVNRPDEL